MMLDKNDYSNMLKLLQTVEIKGIDSAKYLAVLAHKIETRVATWFDGHVTGFEQEKAKVEADAEKVAEKL